MVTDVHRLVVVDCVQGRFPLPDETLATMVLNRNPCRVEITCWKQSCKALEIIWPGYSAASKMFKYINL